MQWMALWLGACMACAQGTLQVLPGGYANVEGNSSSRAFFNTNFSQMLQVYSASEFGFLGGSTGRIDGIALRLDGSTLQSYAGFWPGLAIGLGVTTRSPDSLTPVYGDNEIFNGRTVFSGSLYINATNVAASPRGFEVLISFSAPYFYDPSRGNLAMSVISAAGPSDLILDGQNSIGDGVGRVYGPDGQNSGSVDTFGFVTRFNITSVPEPSTLAIGISFVLCFGLRKLRLSRNRGS
jgi:hypothetical protein